MVRFIAGCDLHKGYLVSYRGGVAVADAQTPRARSDAGILGDEDLGFDIGVAADSNAVSAPQKAKKSERRRLPVWAMVVIALLVGWLLGSLLGSSDSTTESGGFDPRIAQDDSDGVLPDQLVVPPSVLRPETLPGPSGPKLVFVPAPTEGRGSILTMVDQSGTSGYWLGPAEPSDPTSWIAERSIVVNEALFLISGGAVFSLDTERMVTNGRNITPAVGLMPGTGTGTLWAIDAPARLVRLLDAESATVRATYDLSAVGLPLASYVGGLVVAPEIDEFGSFALWNPARGIERIWAIDEDVVFVGAAASTIVMQTNLGVASYNTVTGSLTQIDRQLDVAQLASAKVSPDGRTLAIQGETAVGDPQSIVVVDLSSGEVEDEFQTAQADKMHWVSNDEIVHLGAGDELQVQLRDTSLGLDSEMARLDTPIEWITLVD